MTSSHFVRLESFQCHGLERRLVTIEALRSRGLNQMNLTGLPDAWLRDSRDKIRALVCRYVEWGPLVRVLVHLLPADESKNGAHLELPIVLACLAVLSAESLSLKSRELLRRYRFVGALSLEGKIHATNLSESIEKSAGPLVIGPSYFSDLGELWAFILKGEDTLPERKSRGLARTLSLSKKIVVEGRLWERFWLYVAAIAEVPVLLVGPPGVGKSHLAQWAERLLPIPEGNAQAQIQQMWTLVDTGEIPRVPLVNPHSRANLSEFLGINRFGIARPGFFALAHRGLLVLDEFSEMNRDCREILRTILDQKKLIRHTTTGLLTWPADFWLIATTNPCPCGQATGQSLAKCRCLENARLLYQSRISGPVFDRMGLRIFMTKESAQSQVPPQMREDAFDRMDDGALREKVRLKRGELDTFLPESRIALKGQFSSTRERELKARLLAALRTFPEIKKDEALLTLHLLHDLEKSMFAPREKGLLHDARS